MTTRRLFAVLPAALVAALAFSACTPDPAPTPTPTGFASEEEAFAAAEETYRAYIDALNARNAGDEDADPQEYLVGEALEAEIDVELQKERLGLSIVGETSLTSFTLQSISTIEGSSTITAQACLDSSQSDVIDETGEAVTLESQLTQYALSLTFITTGEHLRISSSQVEPDASC